MARSHPLRAEHPIRLRCGWRWTFSCCQPGAIPAAHAARPKKRLALRCSIITARYVATPRTSATRTPAVRQYHNTASCGSSTARPILRTSILFPNFLTRPGGVRFGQKDGNRKCKNEIMLVVCEIRWGQSRGKRRANLCVQRDAVKRTKLLLTDGNKAWGTNSLGEWQHASYEAAQLLVTEGWNQSRGRPRTSRSVQRDAVKCARLIVTERWKQSLGNQ